MSVPNENPPKTWITLVQEGIDARLDRDHAQWRLGLLANQVETQYGKNQLAQYAQEIRVHPSTLRRYRDVVRSYSSLEEVDLFDLPFDHFQQVAKLTPSKRLETLERAKNERWSTRDTRAYVGELRGFKTPYNSLKQKLASPRKTECDICQTNTHLTKVELCGICLDRLREDYEFSLSAAYFQKFKKSPTRSRTPSIEKYLAQI